MPYDIYGNTLKRGHCEVHPGIPEPYPCWLCTESDHYAAQERAYYAQMEAEYYVERENEYESYLKARFYRDRAIEWLIHTQKCTPLPDWWHKEL